MRTTLFIRGETTTTSLDVTQHEQQLHLADHHIAVDKTAHAKADARTALAILPYSKRAFVAISLDDRMCQDWQHCAELSLLLARPFILLCVQFLNWTFVLLFWQCIRVGCLLVFYSLSRVGLTFSSLSRVGFVFSSLSRVGFVFSSLSRVGLTFSSLSRVGLVFLRWDVAHLVSLCVRLFCRYSLICLLLLRRLLAPQLSLPLVHRQMEVLAAISIHAAAFAHEVSTRLLHTPSTIHLLLLLVAVLTTDTSVATLQHLAHLSLLARCLLLVGNVPPRSHHIVCCLI